MSELESLRGEIDALNENFFHFVSTRREIADKIQKLKLSKGLSSYNPERELSLFLGAQSELKKMSLKELGAFSLLMEDQAGDLYPKWSEGKHLASPLKARERESFKLPMRINPLLVLLFHPELFKVEWLKEDLRWLADLIKER